MSCHFTACVIIPEGVRLPSVLCRGSARGTRWCASTLSTVVNNQAGREYATLSGIGCSGRTLCWTFLDCARLSDRKPSSMLYFFMSVIVNSQLPDTSALAIVLRAFCASSVVTDLLFSIRVTFVVPSAFSSHFAFNP